MPNIGTTELILIVAVLLLLFGGSKLPQLARALGQSKRAFREGIDEAEKDTAKQLPNSGANNLSDEELFAEAHRRAQEAKR
jgi:sec-independent protein translocase protein TatA